MATLLEQRDAAENTVLRTKVLQALIVSAQKILDENAVTTANHATRLVWAKRVITNPEAFVEEMRAYIIAKNSGSSLAQIIAASDATVQANIDDAVNAFA